MHGGFFFRFLLLEDEVLIRGAVIVYMKIVSGGAVSHLRVIDQFSTEFKMLCRCTITQSQSWKRIGSIERDEYPHCAELAFRQ